MAQDYLELLAICGIDPRDQDLFREAFTHRSALNEKKGLVEHNERLEFLGDAVLELVTTEFLFHTFPSRPEGELTNIRAALVRREHLAQVARRLDLGSYLHLSKGEARSGGASKDYLLANVVEALIGALYIDQGMEKTANFIQKNILCDTKSILETNQHIDAKSAFQELTQGKLGITPHYEVVADEGLDHEKTFIVAAFLEKKKVGQGEGKSKKEAQNSAAENALERQKEWLGKHGGKV